MSRLTSLEEKLEKLPKLPSNCCIYRVPERLRQINEKAYTPQVVSIGPLHHGRKELKFMEEHKLRYLQEFLRRSRMSLEELGNIITNEEENLRGCYAEAINLNRDEFVEMVLVDATFIIEVLLRHKYPYLQNEQDFIFKQPYLIQDVWYDMWLLENQLPFFILEDVFRHKKVRDSVPDNNLTMIFLTYEFFKSIEAVNGKLEKLNNSSTRVEHFTDFFRICHLPSKLPPRCPPYEMKTNVITAPSAIELHRAGVRFKQSESNELFDINFTNDGTLEIPKLKLELETESLFRNLIAFEQRHYSDNYINDYVFILHHLVNTPKDVELLVQDGIIDNWLPDKEAASTLINNLSSGTTLFPKNFYFSRVCDELKEYCEARCNKWRANLQQNYFNTPWASISVVGAIFLLLLTLIQAVCSIIQVVSQPNK